MDFLFIPLFAFFYRARGGLFEIKSTQLKRVLFWALPVGAWAWWVTSLWWMGLLCSLAAFGGMLIGHGEFHANNRLRSVLGMSTIGLARLSFILAPFLVLNPVIAIFSFVGIGFGFAYWLGWHLHGVLGIGGSEWGEWITGGFFGLAFALIGCCNLSIIL